MRRTRFFQRICAALLAAVLAVLCCAAAWAAEEPGYVRTVFNKANGLPTDEANAVLQTSDGYLWVGSFGGLLRYNGTTFRNFSDEGAISTPSVCALFEDSAGRLWIGSSDAGVFLYENDVFTPIPCTDKYGFLSIRDFAEDSSGRIYVASTSGVCEVRDGQLVPLDDLWVSGETIYSLGVDPYDRLWCAMNAKKCAVLQDGHCVAMLEGDDFFAGGERIACLTSDSAHDLYLGTNGTALAKVSCTGTALDGSDFDVRLFRTDDVEYHNRICVTGDGSILVSGEQGFAYMTADGEMVDPHTSARTNAVNWATIDSEGDVWLASSNEGLIRYAPGYFTTPNYETGLTGQDINAITEADGLFYAATDAGLLAFDSGWQPVHNAVTDLLADAPVKHLLVDSRGRLWCSTYSDLGIVRYDPTTGDTAVFNSENGVKSSHIRLAYELADGTVAVGTQDGLALIDGDTITAFYDKSRGVETQSILCIAQAPDGTLLVGSAGSGIYAIRPDGALTRYSYEQGLMDGVVLRIVPAESGDGWFVSAGSHLYYWLDDTFRRFDELDIGAGSIFDLFERSGRLWLLQDSGLYAVNETELFSGEAPHAAHYGTSDGLTGSLSMNNWNYFAPDGRLYLSTRSGISVFDFRVMEPSVPRLVIDSVHTDDGISEHPEIIRLPRDNRRVTIYFSALTLSGTADLCIAYQLEGFGRNETVLYNTSGSVSYTNLDGGTYTFRLRVFDPDVPQEQQTLKITVVKEKSLTEMPLAWIIGLVLLVAAAFGISQLIIHAKMKRLRQQRQVYRSIVRQALRTFANTIDAKDPCTNGHSVRVALYSREIARRMGFSEEDQERVYYIALLHDIGKIGIPDSILNKAGALTPEERAVIQTHTEKGGEILRDFTALRGIADGARYHHERYDGKGYCAGLAGEDIPLVGRIIGVADSYDAMSSDRCYRKALPREQVLEELKNGSGTQFDPKIAAIMVDMIYEGAAPVSPDDTRLPPPDSAPAPDENTPDKK